MDGKSIPQGISIALIVILIVTMIIFLTELTSNMATTATFLPVVAAIAIQSDFNPMLVTAAVALAAKGIYVTCCYATECHSLWVRAYKSASNG